MRRGEDVHRPVHGAEAQGVLLLRAAPPQTVHHCSIRIDSSASAPQELLSSCTVELWVSSLASTI